jgi:hypothetical protein
MGNSARARRAEREYLQSIGLGWTLDKIDWQHYRRLFSCRFVDQVWKKAFAASAANADQLLPLMQEAFREYLDADLGVFGKNPFDFSDHRWMLDAINLAWAVDLVDWNHLQQIFGLAVLQDVFADVLRAGCTCATPDALGVFVKQRGTEWMASHDLSRFVTRQDLDFAKKLNRKHGRGAVILDIKEMSTIGYMPMDPDQNIELSEHDAQTAQSFLEAIQPYLDAYDPDTQAVFVLTAEFMDDSISIAPAVIEYSGKKAELPALL